MLRMYLNGNTEECIEISSYNRSLILADPAIKFSLNISMSDNYSPLSMEYLANYDGVTITSINITDEEDRSMLESTNIVAELRGLNENCDSNGRYGYAEIVTLNPIEEELETPFEGEDE